MGTSSAISKHIPRYKAFFIFAYKIAIPHISQPVHLPTKRPPAANGVNTKQREAGQRNVLMVTRCWRKLPTVRHSFLYAGQVEVQYLVLALGQIQLAAQYEQA